MKLTIFAATGGIGRQALEQALAAGHEVTAVVRNPNGLSGEARIVRVDLAAAAPEALESAVAGADGVLSGLGPRSASEAGIASQGTRAIVHAMRATDVRRIVVVSAAPIGTVPSPGRPRPPKHDPGDGFFMRHLLSPLTKAALRTRYGDFGADGGPPSGQRPGLDRRATAPADQQGTDRHLPDSVRAEPPARAPHVTRRRRPSHALRARATRDHQASHWNRHLTVRASPYPRDGRLRR